MSAPTTTFTSYLDYEGVAARLNLTVNTVRRLVREEGLPAHTVARRVRFLPDEVDTWLSQQAAVRGTAPATPPSDRPSEDWVAAQVAKFSPEDLRRAGELLLTLANGAHLSKGAA